MAVNAPPHPHHVHILENGNLQFKAYIGPRGNNEKVGAEDEGAPVGKEVRFAREVMPTDHQTDW